MNDRRWPRPGRRSGAVPPAVVRLLAVVGLLAVAGLPAGCGVPSTGVIPAGPAPAGVVVDGATPVGPPPEPSASPGLPEAVLPDASAVQGDQPDLRVYFLSGGRLSPVRRPPSTGPGQPAADPVEAVGHLVTALLDGPSRAEQRAGLSTGIPAGTALSSVEVGDEQVEVLIRLGSPAVQLPGPAAAQLSCTLAANTVPGLGPLSEVVRIRARDGRPLPLPGCPQEALAAEPS